MSSIPKKYGSFRHFLYNERQIYRRLILQKENKVGMGTFYPMLKPFNKNADLTLIAEPSLQGESPEYPHGLGLRAFQHDIFSRMIGVSGNVPDRSLREVFHDL